MKKILFYGDSITDCGRDKNNLYCLGKGYALLVKAALSYKYPMQYEFINTGISGNRVVDLYQREKKDLINHKPDYISILIGVNDVWHEVDWQNGVDEKRFEDIYTMLIEDIKAALPDTKIFIMEPFVLKGDATAQEDPSRWEAFKTETPIRAAAAKRVADKFGLPFIELQRVISDAADKTADNYVLGDGVHPTVYGHTLIAKEWVKCFEENI